jgi:hypothetical protein
MYSHLVNAGGRKFILALLGGFSATLLQWFGHLDPAGMAYGLTIGATVGAYIAGNVVQRKNDGNSTRTL